MSAGVGRVVKVGGSLLTFPRLADTLRTWLERQTPQPTVLVVGGGLLADAIRKYDETHRLSEESSHWMCVDAMRISSRLLAELLPGVPRIERWEIVGTQLTLTRPTSLAILDVAQFLRDVEPSAPGTPLPKGWQVTSDSIAARVARVLEAQELTLLKSAPAPVPPSRRLAAKLGLVDGYFPEASDGIPLVRHVNLRGPDFAEHSLSAQ